MVGSTVVIKGGLTAHEDVSIAGRVEGVINVTGHRVDGDLSAPRVVIADGALVNGRIETVVAAAPQKLKAAS